MASTQKCQYCGATISSEEKTCPSCGAPNPNYVEDTKRTVFFPKTIAELQEYCAERGMPLLRMRFFIGENYKEPKAFGIYKDGDDFVVYKNKANGTDYDSDWGVSDFKESSAYQSIVESHSSGSSDYDSWDSGGTDWDSDW